MIAEFDRIVVIDFETTGTSRDKRAVEVAWFELNKNLEIIDEQASLINPMIPIPWEVIAIHGITDDMVKDSPTLDEFIVDVQEDTFANSSVCVVAHNLSVDLPLFKKYCGNVVELCTLKLARNLYPEFNNHKLSTISERFGFVHEEVQPAEQQGILDLFGTTKFFGRLSPIEADPTASMFLRALEELSELVHRTLQWKRLFDHDRLAN